MVPEACAAPPLEGRPRPVPDLGGGGPPPTDPGGRGGGSVRIVRSPIPDGGGPRRRLRTAGPEGVGRRRVLRSRPAPSRSRPGGRRPPRGGLAEDLHGTRGATRRRALHRGRDREPRLRRVDRRARSERHPRRGALDDGNGGRPGPRRPGPASEGPRSRAPSAAGRSVQRSADGARGNDLPPEDAELRDLPRRRRLPSSDGDGRPGGDPDAPAPNRPTACRRGHRGAFFR
jgi:hypothetical protein